MTGNSQKNIAILILFFNKLEETIECINSFLTGEQNIYILNNGSDAQLLFELEKKYKKHSSVMFFNSSENLGPSKGRNKLISLTNEEWLFFVDNDITIQPVKEWVEIFERFISANPFAQIILPRLFNVHDGEYGAHPEFIKNDNKISVDCHDKSKTNYFPSGASIVKREIFGKYGLFDEELFGFEDYEYSIRALCSSYGTLEVFKIDEITLFHHHKFQKSKINKQSVRIRYDEKRLTSSFDHMEKKHGIIFNHNWRWWSKKQVADMTSSNKLRQVINNVNSWLKK